MSLETLVGEAIRVKSIASSIRNCTAGLELGSLKRVADGFTNTGVLAAGWDASRVGGEG